MIDASGAIAHSTDALNDILVERRKENSVPDSFNEKIEDVDRTVEEFRHLAPAIVVGVDADPVDEEDIDGPWVAKGIIIHIEGVLQMRPDVRNLDELQYILGMFAESMK